MHRATPSFICPSPPLPSNHSTAGKPLAFRRYGKLRVAAACRTKLVLREKELLTNLSANPFVPSVLTRYDDATSVALLLNAQLAVPLAVVMSDPMSEECARFVAGSVVLALQLLHRVSGCFKAPSKCFKAPSQKVAACSPPQTLDDGFLSLCSILLRRTTLLQGGFAMQAVHLLCWFRHFPTVLTVTIPSLGSLPSPPMQESIVLRGVNPSTIFFDVRGQVQVRPEFEL